MAGFADPRRQAASTGSEPQQPTEGPAAAAAEETDGRVSIGRRVAAGAADLLVHLAVAVLALAGCRYLGVFPVLPSSSVEGRDIHHQCDDAGLRPGEAPPQWQSVVRLSARFVKGGAAQFP